MIKKISILASNCAARYFIYFVILSMIIEILLIALRNISNTYNSTHDRCRFSFNKNVT